MIAVVMQTFDVDIDVSPHIASHFGSLLRQQSSAPDLFLKLYLPVLSLHNVGFIPESAIA